MALSRRNLIAATLAATLGLLPAAARAQAAPAGPPEPARFRLLSLAETTSVLYDIGSAKERLHAGVGAFSALQPAPAGREVVLYAEAHAATPGQPPVRQTLARTKLPGSGPGPYLIILHPAPRGSELKFGSLVIDQSLEAHPPQTYRVFNFSKRRLAVNLADQNLVLDSGASGAAPYPETRKAWLKVAADQSADGWLLVRSSSHPIGPGTRSCIFLMDIPPTEDVPNPTGVIIRQIRETIVTDDTGTPHVR